MRVARSKGVSEQDILRLGAAMILDLIEGKPFIFPEEPNE